MGALLGRPEIPEHLRVRRAVAADAEALAALAALTFPLACPPDTPREQLDAHIRRHLTEGAFAKHLSDANTEVFVAEDTAAPQLKLLAYTVSIWGRPGAEDVREAIDWDANPDPQATAELSKCYADPRVHGTGVASDLLDVTLRYLTQAGAKTVWLGTNDHNVRAVTFYQKHGFTKCGSREFNLAKEVFTDYVMWLRPALGET